MTNFPPVPSRVDLGHLEFTKMSGAGNDFLVVDNRQGQWNFLKQPQRIQSVCRRDMGVGADGILFLQASKRSHVKVVHFNADGSESNFCGNGTRCAARYALFKVMANRTMRLEVGSVVIEAEVDQDGLVCLHLPAPKLDLEPLQIEDEVSSGTGWKVSAGVPHLVILSDNVADVPVADAGPLLRQHPAFGSKGANVTWIQTGGDQPLPIRTFERGVEAETAACGSGALAAFAVLCNLAGSTQALTFLPPSGETLLVEPQGRGVTLTGKATLIYKGILSPDVFGKEKSNP